jgi:apolipoprotein N-acyltransferase
VANKKDSNILFAVMAERPALSRLAVLVIGCATPLVFAPAGWSLLAPLFILPLLFIALTISPRDAAAHFFWFGFGLFLTGTYWIVISVHVFGNAALWIALPLMLVLALFMASFFRLAGWLMSRLSHGEVWGLLFVAPAAWVVLEWLRGWILTGFPWLSQGYGQIDTPLAGWAPVLGIYGVSFMLLFSSAAILVAIMTLGKQRLIAVALVVMPWLIGGVLGSVDWAESYGKAIRTTIVQAGVSQDQKWLASQRQATLDFYRGATLGVPQSELVVWPEVAIPALQTQVADYLDFVAADARRNGQTILLGILERGAGRDAQAQIFNSVLLLGSEQRQFYRKRHLVPFGEYFPVPASVRQWMKMQNLPYADLAAGRDDQDLLIAASGAALAIAVCYEDAFGAEQLYAFPGADLLVNVSNDAWFGESIAPYQHLQIARMRALEVARYSVRSTNTGVSAFIGPRGELLQTGEQFEEVIMTADIRTRRGTTPYAELGNWPILGLCFTILGFFWIRSRSGI